MLPILAQLEGAPAQNLIDKIARTQLSHILLIVAVLTLIRVALYPKLTKTPKHLRSGSYVYARFGNEFADAIIYAAVVVFMALRPFAVQTFTIPTGSMLETLQINDYVVLDKSIYRRSDPQFGDIVVFKAPEVSLLHGQTEMDYIKRCRGVPGDLIEIKGGVLHRNGQKVEEPFVRYLNGATTMSHDFKLVEKDGKIVPVLMSGGIANGQRGLTADPFLAQSAEDSNDLIKRPAAKIPPGYYLFMGDNREESYDGRSWGLVKRDEIIGKSVAIWFPIARWRTTN